MVFLDKYLPEVLREYGAFLVRARRIENLPTRQVLSLVLTTVWWLWNAWGRAGRVLDQAERVFLLSHAEKVSLIKDTGWRGLNGTMTPNGAPPRIESHPIAAPWSNREVRALIVGRIEPRKRVVEAVEILGAAGVCVDVYGNVDGGSVYGQRFRSLVDAMETVRWFGDVSQVEVVEALSRGRVLVNASFVEVQSLVDIEACLSGCWVINFGTGSSREWLGDGVVHLDEVHGFSRLSETVESCFLTPPPKCSYTVSWEEPSKTIAAAYRSV